MIFIKMDCLGLFQCAYTHTNAQTRATMHTDKFNSIVSALDLLFRLQSLKTHAIWFNWAIAFLELVTHSVRVLLFFCCSLYLAYCLCERIILGLKSMLYCYGIFHLPVFMKNDQIQYNMEMNVCSGCGFVPLILKFHR